MDGGFIFSFASQYIIVRKNTYKIQAQLWNDMFSEPHISTRVSLDIIFGAVLVPEQENKI